MRRNSSKKFTNINRNVNLVLKLVDAITEYFGKLHNIDISQRINKKQK